MPAPPLLRAIFCWLALLLAAPPLHAEGDIDAEEPIPSSARDVVSPMDQLGARKPALPGILGGVRERLQDAPAFFRDTRLTIKPRSYYFRRDRYDDSVNEAWALGGAINYQSGLVYDRLGVGVTLNTSQPLYAPDDRDGTQLLARVQKAYSVASQVYARVRLADDNFVNLYRYGEFNSPYLNKSDSRMTPYSFEGYTAIGTLGGSDGAPQFRYGAGYIAKIKDKNAERFISMSEKAGSGPDVKRGVSVLGGRYSQGGFSLGAIDYYSNDIINIAYAESTYKFGLGADAAALVSVQVTDQRSVGDNLLKNRAFSTRQAGVKAEVGARGAILSLAYTANAKGQDLQNPWSGYPGFTSSMIVDFNKAGVNAVSIKGSYVFRQLGFDGVAAYVLATRGSGMVDQATGAPLPNENEIDVDLQWRPRLHFMSGILLRMRYGRVCQYEGPRQCSPSVRLIANYELPLL